MIIKDRKETKLPVANRNPKTNNRERIEHGPLDRYGLLIEFEA